MKNADMPAAPVEMTLTESGPQALQTGNSTYMSIGLTKREMFAMTALQGLVASNMLEVSDFETAKEWYEATADAAIKHADALLSKLEREE